MRTFSIALLTLILLTSCIYSCKKSVQSVSEPPAPYLHLSEQRAKLAAKPRVVPIRLLDSVQIINDLEYLASDACEGRKPGTAGHTKAMERITARMRLSGLDSFNTSLTQTFLANGNTQGSNIIGWVKGTTYPEKYIVLSAHYDHLGKTPNGATYYGADDNASGVACLLALAKYFKQNPHPYSLIFAAFDKEETSFEGAYNFVASFQNLNKLAAIRFNLNMDMIARSDSGELFACGIRRYPSFKYAIEEVQGKTNVKLLMGHDGGASGSDWTHLSDHTAFNQKSIPFLYIGVEDHSDYHKTTDTYSRINYSSYLENCNMILTMTQILKP